MALELTQTLTRYNSWGVNAAGA